MSKINGLPPIIRQDARILILGSMPSVESLRTNQYYGNPRNHFWRIIYTIFTIDVEEDYSHRVAFIKEKRLALWDVIHSCERKGSLDSNIKNERPNDIQGLFEKYNKIEAVFFNGTMARKTFFKYFNQYSFPVTYYLLPSSSPIPGRNIKALEEKIAAWSKIKDHL